MSIETIKKGRHKVYWRDASGRLRRKTISGVKQRAIQFERDMREKVTRIKAGLEPSWNDCSENEASPISYREFLVQFADRQRAEYSESSGQYHLNAGARFIQAIGNRPLTDYAPQDFLDYRRSLLDRGLANGSVNKHVQSLKTQFGHALELGLVATDPAKTRLLKPLPQATTPRRAFSREELERIVGYTEPPYDSFFVLLYTTGLRVGELWRIKTEDIRGDTLVVPHTKTFRPRQVPLVAEAREAVQRLRGEQGEERLIRTHSCYNSFRTHLATVLKIAYYRSTHGGEVPPYRSRHAIQKMVSNITPQDLRHSFVSILREKGVDSELRARLAGHGPKVDETIYTHVADRTLESAMGQAFGGEGDLKLDEAVLSICQETLRGDSPRASSAAICDRIRWLIDRLEEQVRQGSVGL